MSASETPANSTGRASPQRVAVASFIGTSVEFYDFLIYGTAVSGVSEAVLPKTSLASGCCCRSPHLASGSSRSAAWCSGTSGTVWAQADVGVFPTRDGHLDRFDGSATHLCADRRGRPNTADAAAAGAGLRRRWRVGGATLMAVEHGPTTRKGFYGLPTDGRPGRHRDRNPGVLCHLAAVRRAVLVVGMAHTISCQRRAHRDRAGDSSDAGREPGLRRRA